MHIFKKESRCEILDLQKNKTNDFQGFVYIIEFDDCIKIGCTKNIYNRINTIYRTMESYGKRKLNRIYVSKPHTNYKENEKIIHSFFTMRRIENTELFDISFEKAIQFAERKIEIKNEFEILEKEKSERVKIIFSTIERLGDTEKNNENERFLKEYCNLLNSEEKKEVKRLLNFIIENKNDKNLAESKMWEIISIITKRQSIEIREISKKIQQTA